MGGRGSGQRPHFYKSVEKGFFFPLLVHFCLFLSLFDRNISGNYLHFGRGGGVGL